MFDIMMCRRRCWFVISSFLFFLIVGFLSPQQTHSFSTRKIHINNNKRFIYPYSFVVLRTANDDEYEDSEYNNVGNDDNPKNIHEEDKNNNGDENSSSKLKSAQLGSLTLLLPLPQPSNFTTTMDMKLRELERRLIKQLLKGDDAIIELRKLWFSERGPAIEKLMYEAENGIGHPQNWTRAEQILERLILNDPTYIEPYVRLSKLYCLQGRFEESKQICKSILELKPYHYVVLETMVACNLAQDNNQQLLLYASKRLPTPSHKELRKQWVDQAIEDSIRIQQQQQQQQDVMNIAEKSSFEDDNVDEDDENNRSYPWQ